jgi:hypothetical protein
MARQWVSVAGGHAGVWDIPAAPLTEFGSLITAAESALKFAKNENSRTPVATAWCKKTFDALSVFMRDFKRRYFLSPPLTDADFVSLGLTSPTTPRPLPQGSPWLTSWWSPASSGGMS